MTPRTRLGLLVLVAVVVAIVAFDVRARSRAQETPAPVARSSEEPSAARVPEVQRGLDKTPLVYPAQFVDQLVQKSRDAFVTAAADGSAAPPAAGIIIGTRDVLVASAARATAWTVRAPDGRTRAAVRRATDPVHGMSLLTLQEDAASIVSFGPPALTSGSPVVAVRPLADVLVTQLLPAPGSEASLAARLAWSPLPPGTSVIDLDGRLVAFFGSGVGGGVPLVATDLEQRLLPPLREGVTPAAAWLGADLQAVDGRLAARVGEGVAVVAFVEPGSPAAAAGLRARDVVVAATADGQPVTALDVLPAGLQPGMTVELEVRRGADVRRVRVTLGQRVYPVGVSAVTGVAVDGGAPVLRIAPASPLAEAGLRTGDAVEDVDGQAVDAAGLERVLRRGRSLLLTVRRDGRRLLVIVPAAGTAVS